MKTGTRRPLWRLLLALKGSKHDEQFNCDECFRLLEYLADIRANNTMDEKRYLTLIKQHLSVCSGCREHYAQMLRQMEQTLNNKIPANP